MSRTKSIIATIIAAIKLITTEATTIRTAVGKSITATIIGIIATVMKMFIGVTIVIEATTTIIM